MQTKSSTNAPQTEAAELGRVLRDFAHALQADPHALIAAFASEPDPDFVQLVYHPPAAAPGSGAVSPGASGAARIAAATAVPGVQSGIATGDLPANFRCDLCPDRMYPVRRYNREGRRRILVLYHSGSFGARGPARLDRSRETIFGSPEEDDLFTRMLGAVNLEIDELHYQEYPACHFNAVRSAPDDWSQRGEHCLSHVRDTISRHDIELLILTGPAAVILLGEERARALSAECGRAMISAGEREVPALVMRSPAALIALETKRKRLQERGEEQSAAAAVAEEKRIKKQVVAALKAAVPPTP
ncbi:MAG: hypothetical protein NXI24_19995 [bacterium]|nr:hypothetical protein [bacterium]